MTTSPLMQVVRHLRRGALVRDGAGLSDGDLLEAFITARDEAAFEALVRRHGPMVMGVCRRVIGNAHDAEDAFQATFLVLARKAASVVPREAVGNWLYGVAYRTGLEARAKITRQHAKEKQVTDMPHPKVQPAGVWPELQPVLDQELSRLPDKYRQPLVLCELEGKSRKEVARQLRLPEGTLSSRLATARKMLAKRLTRHGLVLSGGALATVLAQNAASACVPPPLVVATVQAAGLLAAGETVAGVISAQVAALAEGVLKAMLMTKIKVTAAFLIAIGLVAAGGGSFAHRSLAGPAADRLGAPAAARTPALADEEPVAEEAAAADRRARPKPEAAPAPAEAPTIVGKVVAYEANKSITIESTTRAGTRKSDFSIVKDKTKIELPNRVKDIQVGMILPVWADKDDPKLAIRIGQQQGPANKPSTTRPPK